MSPNAVARICESGVTLYLVHRSSLLLERCKIENIESADFVSMLLHLHEQVCYNSVIVSAKYMIESAASSKSEARIKETYDKALHAFDAGISSYYTKFMPQQYIFTSARYYADAGPLQEEYFDFLDMHKDRIEAYVDVLKKSDNIIPQPFERDTVKYIREMILVYHLARQGAGHNFINHYQSTYSEYFPLLDACKIAATKNEQKKFWKFWK